MSLLSGLLGGVTGFLTGGPLGALTGALGSLSGGDKQQSGAAAPAQVTPTLALDQSSATQSSHEKAFFEGYMQELQNMLQKPTVYNAQAALAGGPLQGQRANQQGGMSFPSGPASANTMMPKQYGRGDGKGAGGEGRGAGGGSLSDWWNSLSGGSSSGSSATVSDDQQWRDLLRGIYATGNQAGAAAQLQPGFTDYMQKALAGQQTLPPELYQLASQEGQRVINAQAANARGSLTQNLGSRGLANSGLMSRGLVDVERGRLGSLGQLASGLQQQNLQSALEAQRAAAGMWPNLLGIQNAGVTDQARTWLQQQQLELQRRGQNLAQGQYQDAQNAAFWGNIGGAIPGLVNLFGGGNSADYKNKLNL